MYKKILRELVPPLFNRFSSKNRLFRANSIILMEFYRLLKGKSADKLKYDEILRTLKENSEIERLFPESRMEEHYVYGNVRNTIEHPDLYGTQIRFYRVYDFFKKNYPDMFKPETKVLDVGDTSGILFQAMGKDGVSLNINQECVDYINKKGIRAVRGSAENIGFQDKSFDYCLCFQCLEHLPNPLMALNELGRVARKKVFISIPNTEKTTIYNIEYWIDLKKSSWGEANVRDVDCHIFEFSTADLKNLLSYTNLEYEMNFPINYFDNTTLKGSLLNGRFTSYFNFFVLRSVERERTF